MGSVKTVLNLWNECSNAYVAAIVTVEDSTTRAKLSHSMAKRVAAGTMTKAEQRYKPRKPGHLGAKKTDSRELPLEDPEIEKYSDRIHYVKNYKSELYIQVALPKSKSETCKADGMRLSRNLSYMLGQCTPTRDNKDCTFDDLVKAGEASFGHHWNNHCTPARDNKDCIFDDFVKAGEASFEHQYNNHEHCGCLWCQAKSWTEEEKVKGKGKYRDKETHEKEYKQQLLVKDKYLSTTRLRGCFDEFCNNKTEHIHGLIVNVFLPKRAFFCRTICGRSPTYMAVGILLGGIRGVLQGTLQRHRNRNVGGNPHVLPRA
jgi:hypothetical protein